MKVKRWIFLCALAIVLIAAGSVEALRPGINAVRIRGTIVIVLGVILLITGMRRFVRSFITIFLPKKEKELVNIVYQKRHLAKAPKVVAIGGGTGLSVLLHGLKEYTSNITAIVTVADDGGSSGRLREQFDVLPPGDIRNCLVALADAEPLMRQLFQFRFDKDSEFGSHNFGNLFITAMSKITGDFEEAIRTSSRILAIRGQVIPSTLNKVNLLAEHVDGTETKGEASISESRTPIKRVQLVPGGSVPSAEVSRAIREAEAILLGPGSLYTSIIPNLLVGGMADMIVASKALKVYICNVMTQAGETDGYTASQHLEALIAHTKQGLVDSCIVNTGKVPEKLLSKYQQEGSYPVEVDSDRIRELGPQLVEAEVISTTDFVRHNSQELARIIMSLISEYKVK